MPFAQVTDTGRSRAHRSTLWGGLDERLRPTSTQQAATVNTGHGWKAVSAAVVLALALDACGPAREVQMVAGPRVAASIGSGNVPINASVSVGSMDLCISAAGRATIRSVAVHDPTGDIVVEAFATRPTRSPGASTAWATRGRPSWTCTWTSIRPSRPS